MTNPKATLKDLIQMANDGADFYADAAKEVKMPQVRDLFGRMSGHKRSLSATLSRRLENMGDKAPESGTIAGTLRKAYADVRATFSSNEDKVYVGQLEETEDKMLHHFEDALNDPDNASIHLDLAANIGQVRACHDEMRNWKNRLEAAA